MDKTSSIVNIIGQSGARTQNYNTGGQSSYDDPAKKKMGSLFMGKKK